jgi:hypothetical protein
MPDDRCSAENIFNTGPNSFRRNSILQKSTKKAVLQKRDICSIYKENKPESEREMEPYLTRAQSDGTTVQAANMYSELSNRL